MEVFFPRSLFWAIFTAFCTKKSAQSTKKGVGEVRNLTALQVNTTNLTLSIQRHLNLDIAYSVPIDLLT